MWSFKINGNSKHEIISIYCKHISFCNYHQYNIFQSKMHVLLKISRQFEGIYLFQRFKKFFNLNLWRLLVKVFIKMEMFMNFIKLNAGKIILQVSSLELLLKRFFIINWINNKYYYYFQSKIYIQKIKFKQKLMAN